MAEKRIGKRPPVYSLLLNPHAEARLSRCPRCEKLTYPRKFALMILLEKAGPYVQAKTCKYCSKCKMILVQQDELEGELGRAAVKHFPAALGQEYAVVGVVEMKTFKAGLAGDCASLEGVLEHVSEIRKQYGLGYSPGGWYPKAATPRVLPAFREQRVPVLREIL